MLKSMRLLTNLRVWSRSVGGGTAAPLHVLLFLLLLLSFPLDCTCYRVGDVVDTIIKTSKESTDALNSQMPMFGVSSTALFTEAPSDTSFSLAFQEGMRPLPWIEMVNHKKVPLKEVIVTFVYSKSGDGTIHAVSSETIYDKNSNQEEGFRVKYQWIEEEEVDLQSGSIAMFLGVCVVSIMVLVQSCKNGSSGGFDASQRDGMLMNDAPSYDAYQQSNMHATGIPKWD